MMVWCMAEMGIAVIAGCLPTIWTLVTSTSVQSMLASLRRTISLERLRSSRQVSKSALSRSRAGSQSESEAQVIDVESKGNMA